MLQKGGVERKEDANFNLPIKNPNLLLKNGFRIQIPKLAKNWADSGFGLPTLVSTIAHNKKSYDFLKKY